MNNIHTNTRNIFWALLAIGTLAFTGMGKLNAGEPGRGGHHDSPRDHSPRGSVSLWYTPPTFPTRTPQIRRAPAPAPMIVVPAPELLTCTDGSIIQRTYYVYNGVLTYQDTLIQSAPVVVQSAPATQVLVQPAPAPVVIQPEPVVCVPAPAPQPTWVNILRGIGLNIRW